MYNINVLLIDYFLFFLINSSFVVKEQRNALNYHVCGATANRQRVETVATVIARAWEIDKDLSLHRRGDVSLPDTTQRERVNRNSPTQR